MRLNLVRQWKKRKGQDLVNVTAILVGSVVVLALFGLSVWGGTGFGENKTKTTKELDKAGNVVKTTEEIQSRKTLWDGLQLVGVPAALTIGGYLLNQREQRRAEERQREETLQTYLDRISELLIDKELGNQTLIKNPARYVARARTLTVLRSLAEDGPRKGAILRFLCEAELIRGNFPIISLQEADLRGADLRGAILFEANLAEARLDRADLDGANLREVDLFEAKLSGANLRGADLSKASLLSADLRGARLDRADLQGADLGGANLREADLFEAKLQGADLGGADLKGATSNDANKRPDGFKPDKAGMKEKD